MAKQVIWSLVAKKQLKETFQILKLKNGNNEVSEVLYVQLQNILHRISMNPFIGQTTEIENIRLSFLTRDIHFSIDIVSRR